MCKMSTKISTTKRLYEETTRLRESLQAVDALPDGFDKRRKARRIAIQTKCFIDDVEAGENETTGRYAAVVGNAISQRAEDLAKEDCSVCHEPLDLGPHPHVVGWQLVDSLPCGHALHCRCVTGILRSPQSRPLTASEVDRFCNHPDANANARLRDKYGTKRAGRCPLCNAEFVRTDFAFASL